MRLEKLQTTISTPNKKRPDVPTRPQCLNSST